jgi:hypothetical protein
MKLSELEVYGFTATTLGVGVQQFKKKPFTLYPNPVTNGVLNITGNEEVQSVDVYNLLGAKMNTPFEKGPLVVKDLTPGIYFLSVNKKYSFKFIKK